MIAVKNADFQQVQCKPETLKYAISLIFVALIIMYLFIVFDFQQCDYDVSRFTFLCIC